MDTTLALIAAITALAAVLLGPLVSIWSAQKQANVSVISTNRQAWINALRDSVAEYLSIANYVHVADWRERPESEYNEKMDRLSFLLSKIRLMLNPNEDDHKNLAKSLSGFAMLCANARDEKDKDKWHLAHNDSLALTQAILKREWERVKRVV